MIICQLCPSFIYDSSLFCSKSSFCSRKLCFVGKKCSFSLFDSSNKSRSCYCEGLDILLVFLIDTFDCTAKGHQCESQETKEDNCIDDFWCFLKAKYHRNTCHYKDSGSDNIYNKFHGDISERRSISINTTTIITICVSYSMTSILSLLSVDSKNDNHSQAKGQWGSNKETRNNFYDFLSV